MDNRNEAQKLRVRRARIAKNPDIRTRRCSSMRSAEKRMRNEPFIKRHDTTRRRFFLASDFAAIGDDSTEMPDYDY